MNMDDNFIEFEEPTPEDEKKDNKTKIIIIVAVAVVLCCCCGALTAAWFTGDYVMEWLNLL